MNLFLTWNKKTATLVKRQYNSNSDYNQKSKLKLALTIDVTKLNIYILAYYRTKLAYTYFGVDEWKT